MKIPTLILVSALLTHSGQVSPAHAQSANKPPADPKQAQKQSDAPPPLAEPGATSTSKLALPFKRAWQHLTEDAITLAPTLDQGRIYLPLAGGRVFCLDRETGSLLWSSEPGGLISAPVAASGSAVYIVTRRVAEDGTEAGASLRAADKATGLTIWARDYQRPFTSPLALAEGRIYAGSADGSFYALDSKSGEIVWKVETQDIVRGRALVTARAIYFGSDDGSLRAVEPAQGHLLWKFQTGGKVACPAAADDRAIYFGSSDGFVYALDLETGKQRWRSRTGAAVEAPPVIVNDRVIVASFDNFIYALSRTRGDRIWKRRLENRITAAPIVEGDATMIAPLRSDYVAVFLNADGKRVNIYQLEREFEIVADPVFFGDTLVLATNKGLVVATATAHPENRANAIKK